MPNEIVSAARWIGGSMVLSSCVLVAGLRWPSPPAAPPTVPVQEAAPLDVPTPAIPMTAEEARTLLTPIVTWLAATFPQGDSNDRIQRLLAESEELRKLELEWERRWFTDEKKPGETVERLPYPRSE